MRSVVATGFGPKLVDGHATDEPSIHFFLRTKRPSKSVERARRVPKTIAGFATDVIAGHRSVGVSDLSLSAEAVPIGFGQAVCSSDGERGTVTCSAVDAAGQVVFITAAHYVTEGRDVLDDPGINGFGTVRTRVKALPGEAMYPGTSAGGRACSVNAR
jgi:hypothetical protein